MRKNDLAFFLSLFASLLAVMAVMAVMAAVLGGGAL